MSEEHGVDVAMFTKSLAGGGAERMFVNLANGFRKNGLAVDLLLEKSEGPYLKDLNSRVSLLELQQFRGWTKLGKLTHYMNKRRPRSMITTLNEPNILGIWAKIASGQPTRLVIRQTSRISSQFSLRSWLLSQFVRKSYNLADGIVAISKDLSCHLIEHHGIDTGKVRVIYNPVITGDFLASNEEATHPWFEDKSIPVILGAGRLIKTKGFSTLIRAFNKVQQTHSSRLMIIGEGPERPALENLIERLGLKSSVLLPGFIRNPMSFMSKAGVFVLSSLEEGFGNVLVEAMAAGTRVVATNCPGGPPEILEGGRWGELVPVGDARAMAAAIEAALTATSTVNYDKSLVRFHRDKIVKEYLSFLDFD